MKIYKGVIRRIWGTPRYEWVHRLSKWEDDEFEDDRLPKHTKQVEQEEYRRRRYGR